MATFDRVHENRSAPTQRRVHPIRDPAYRRGRMAPTLRRARRTPLAIAITAVAWLFIAACGGQQPPPIVVEHEVEVRLVGSGEGAVVSRPNGIDTDDGSFVASYVEGTRLTLRAIEGDDSRFEGFSLNGGGALACESGSGPTSCVVNVDRALSIDVAFTTLTSGDTLETLTVTVSGDGSGAVTSFPAGVDTGSDALTADFEQGTVISLTASADPDSTFTGFSFPDQPGRACEAGSTSTSCVLTLDGTLVVDARFDELPMASPQRYDLLADVPITAGELALDLPADTSVLGVEPLREVAVRYAVVDDRLHLAWLGDDAAAGGQVQVRLSHEIDPASITFTAVAYASLGGSPLAADAFAWSGPSETATSVGLDLDALPPHDASVTLQASFADSPLADLDGNGVLDVRDAMLLLQRLQSGGWTAFQRYHGDVDGDDVIDGDDLALLLERLVDTTLPARVHVKPSSLAFTDLDASADGPGLVLVANAGRAPFGALAPDAPEGTVVAPRGGAGLSGQSAVFDVSLPSANRRGWTPGYLRFRDGHGAPSAAGVRLGHVVVLIAGQSNAVGFGDPVDGWGHVPNPAIRVLDTLDVWRNASEPLHQNGRYSFGTRLGELLLDATGFETYLIPSALSGSGIQRWLPSSDDLFPPAIRRARVSAGLEQGNTAQPFPAEGGPVSVLVWYQGEADAATSGSRAAFVERTDTVMDAFVAELDMPVIYVQLASHNLEANNQNLHAVAELQRRMETGASGGAARDRYHMVVAFDLPRSDAIHLSAYGQRALAERIELALRQHVLGEDVDGTGPRLTSIQWSGNLIGLYTSRVLATNELDPDLFTVFEGSASGSEIAVIDAVRDPANSTGVLLTLERTPGSLPFVRYMARPNLPPDAAGSDQDAWDQIATGTIRASDGGLPLPVFGPLPPF